MYWTLFSEAFGFGWVLLSLPVGVYGAKHSGRDRASFRMCMYCVLLAG